MPRARRKPSHPPDIIRQIAASIPERQAKVAPLMPVAFVETAAQDAGCVVEIVTSDRGTRSKRRYRLHILERLARQRVINESQKVAGLALHDAWCRTQLSPPAISEIYVDASARPDEVAVSQVEAMQQFADLMGHVPRGCRQAVRRVACERYLPQTQRETADLRSGLDTLARAFGY